MTKRQYKNRIKKVRVSSKRVFYIRFRPRAQKLFFPICALILLVGILNYERNERGIIDITNAAVVLPQEKEHGSNLKKDSDENVSEGVPIIERTVVSKVSASATPGAIETIQKVARETDTDWKLLWSICQVESQCNPDRIGDGGKSYGAFQIFLTVHKNVTPNQAKDIAFAANWTAKHCAAYKSDVRMFAKCHNGIAKTSNGWYMDRVENIYQSL